MPKSALRKKVKFKRTGKINNFKLGAVVLISLISLVLLGKLIGSVASLGKPYSPDGVEHNKITWDSRATFNLVIKSEETFILSFNPIKKQSTVLKIPQNVQVNVPYGFGNWSMGSVYKLGQSENPPRGAKLLKETVSNTLGLPVNSYLIIDKPAGDISVVESLRGNPLAAMNLLGSSKTDLSFIEFWQLVWGLKGIRFDKFETMDLENSNLSSWSLRADGSRVLSLNQAKLDQFIQKQIEESRLKDEGLSIGIYNATSQPALAEKAARLVANMGGRVTFIANSPKFLERSVVLGSPSYTATYLSSLFTTPCPKQPLSFTQKLFKWPKVNKESSCIQDPGLPVSRADINIFLGEDYFKEHVGGMGYNVN